MSTSPCTSCRKETDDYELLANGNMCSSCWEEDNDNDPDNDDEDGHWP